MCAIDLTLKERRCLELQLKDAPSIRVYRRTLALLEISDGRSVSQIAGMLRVSREAVYDWVALYIEHRNPASLVDRPISGRPSQWSDEATVILREALEQSPDTLGYMAVNWTMPLLREHIEKQWASGLQIALCVVNSANSAMSGSVRGTHCRSPSRPG